MTGRISNYEISLVETLSRIHLTELINLADFTIYCENGEEISVKKENAFNKFSTVCGQ